MENKTLMEHEVYNKNWILGRKKSREVTILLDMVITINQKLKHIEHDRITIYNNNKLLVQGIRFPLLKENQYTVEAGVEISEIRQIIKILPIEIDIV